MLEKIQNFIDNRDYRLEEAGYYKKVTPRFFTHDEISYHIDSLVSLTIHLDNSKQEFILYQDSQVETIGEELEVDLEDFIDFDTIDSDYTNALSHLKSIKETLSAHKNISL